MKCKDLAEVNCDTIHTKKVSTIAFDIQNTKFLLYSYSTHILSLEMVKISISLLNYCTDLMKVSHRSY